MPAIISSKAGLKHTGRAVDAMRAVAAAYKARSLAAFQAALSAYEPELVADVVVHGHLDHLYGSLLEQNLARLVEPYSRVEVHCLLLLGVVWGGRVGRDVWEVRGARGSRR